MKICKRSRSVLSVAVLLTTLVPAAVALDVVWPHNLCGSPGETKYLDMWARVSNPDANKVEWCIQNLSGDDFDVGFGQTEAEVDPYSNGYFRIMVAFTVPVTACAGEQARYQVDIKVDGSVVATATGRITAWGEKGGNAYTAVEPDESHAETPVAGDLRRVSFVVQNVEIDGLPHTYSFTAFTENPPAPSLDLYTLTPVAGFDLPTVVGAGTPLLSGQLEEIPPFGILEVEIDVQTIGGQEDGEGNLLWLEVVDDTSPAALSSSSAVVISCSLDAVPSATERNGTGVNPSILSSAEDPIIGEDWSASIDTSVQAGATFSVLVGTSQPTAPIPTPYGEVLVAPAALGGTQLLSSVVAASGGVDSHLVPIPDDACLGGLPVYTQAVLLGGGVSLGNALDLVLGF